MVTLSFGLMDQYDIEESFEALDEDKLGRLSIDQAYTLLLGLGYLRDYKQKTLFTPSDLKDSVRRIVRGRMDEDGTGQWVSLTSLLLVVEKLPSLLQRDRSANLAHGFRLLDADQKGFIVDSDLQRLAEDMGDTMSVSDAQAMIETSIQYVSSDQRDGQNQLELDEFRRIFAPPSP